MATINIHKAEHAKLARLKSLNPKRLTPEFVVGKANVTTNDLAATEKGGRGG